ncbi:MAG: porin family protein [Cellulophaga sp.]
MKFIVLFSCFIYSISLSSQVEREGEVTDTRYFEDQFYIGVSYNLLLEKPQDVKRKNMSYGLSVGVIKDIPLNKKRNVAIGVGIGYAVNSYYTNLLAAETGDIRTYTIETEDNFKRNKIETHLLELPIEFRWRESTPENHKFWRLYAGVKFGYAFANRSKFVSNEKKVSFFNEDIGSLQYGATISFGYNTWNLHLYYPLNSLFKDDIKIDNGENLIVKPVRIGVIFYIL